MGHSLTRAHELEWGVRDRASGERESMWCLLMSWGGWDAKSPLQPGEVEWEEDGEGGQLINRSDDRARWLPTRRLGSLDTSHRAGGAWDSPEMSSKALRRNRPWAAGCFTFFGLQTGCQGSWTGNEWDSTENHSEIQEEAIDLATIGRREGGVQERVCLLSVDPLKVSDNICQNPWSMFMGLRRRRNKKFLLSSPGDPGLLVSERMTMILWLVSVWVFLTLPTCRLKWNTWRCFCDSGPIFIQWCWILWFLDFFFSWVQAARNWFLIPFKSDNHLLCQMVICDLLQCPHFKSAKPNS